MVINYGAILVCGVVSMIIGFVWYGPLFGKMWMEVMGVGMMSEEQKQAMRKNMWGMYAVQFVLSIITISVLAFHIANWADASASSVAIALCTWFGFVLTTEASTALWSGKPKKLAWKMFLLSSGAQLVSFIVFGLILGAW
jgi:hypothetical protein